MKRSDRVKKEAEQTMAKIKAICRHIRNVQDNCLLLGEKLFEKGEIELGRQLIANGFIHDASKFHGIEFDYLSITNPTEETTKLKLKLAVIHHRKINLHHVEHWSKGITEMPLVYLAEMVCDIKARSEEFGTSLRDYINNEAIVKWNITTNDEIYKQIMEFVDLLCPIPFEQIK